MPTDSVRIQIELDDGSIKKGFASIEREGKSSGKKVGDELEKKTKNSLSKGGKSGFSSLQKIGIGAAAAIGTALAGVFAARAFINAAKVQEDAVNALNSSLFATGKFTEQASLDFQNYASTLQQNSKFGDEAILQNAALIQSLGDLSQDGLKGATQAALDLSAALSIDLNTASTLVGKAAAGNVSSFSRYGVAIKTGANNAETFSNALDALNSKFGGAAARQLQTFSGATTQLSNTFGDLFEELGFIITRSPLIISFVNAAQKSISILIGIVKSNAGAIRSFLESAFNGIRNGIRVAFGAIQILKDTLNDSEFFGAVNSGIGGIGNTIRENLIPALGFTVNIFNGVVNTLKTGFQAILTGFLTLAQGANKALELVGISTGFGEQLDMLAENSRVVLEEFSVSASESLGKAFSPETFETTGQEFLDGLSSFTEEAKAITLDEETQQSPFFKLLEPFSEENTANAINSTANLASGIKSNLGKVTKAVSTTAKQASFDMKTRLASGISQGIQNITQSLINGENLFKNFAKFLLGTFGDLAIQLGGFFIAQGIAVEALNAVSGSGAIVAGAALIALGTLLKSFSGGSGASAAPQVGSGSPQDTFPSAATGDSVVEAEEEREGQGSVVNLTVQGDIFDSRDTSRRISTLLAEALEDEDVTINQGAFA